MPIELTNTPPYYRPAPSTTQGIYTPNLIQTTTTTNINIEQCQYN